MSLVIPAVLPVSKRDFDEKLALFAEIPSVNRIQIDIVDGKFATPASWPYTDLQEFRGMLEREEMLPYLDRVAYEIDLMCFDAEQAASVWLALGASRITFHAESATDLPRLLSSARKHYGAGCNFISCLISFGLAINISSDLSLIEQCLGEIEYVQFMGIERIGRQGQTFDRRVLEKVRMFRLRHPEISVQVDGGVSLESAKELIALGVSNLVVGSALSRAKDPSVAFATFEMLHTPYGV